MPLSRAVIMRDKRCSCRFSRQRYRCAPAQTPLLPYAVKIWRTNATLFMSVHVASRASVLLHYYTHAAAVAATPPRYVADTPGHAGAVIVTAPPYALWLQMAIRRTAAVITLSRCRQPAQDAINYYAMASMSACYSARWRVSIAAQRVARA